MSIAKCCECGETIITTRHIEDKSKALCGICLFNNAFETAWNESDNESKGHIDYWAKMKLRVRDKLKFVLCDGGENE